MSQARVIGLDVGTSSLKGVVIDERGALIGEAERPYPVSRPHPGWSEQDPEQWWQAAQEVLDELAPTRPTGSGSAARCTGWWPSDPMTGHCVPRSSGTTGAASPRPPG